MISFAGMMPIPHNPSVKLPVRICKHIEYDLPEGGIMLQEPRYGFHRNLCRLFLREMKYAGGYAAECNGLDVMLYSQFKTRLITPCQKSAVLPAKGACDVWSHRMQHIPGREI